MTLPSGIGEPREAIARPPTLSPLVFGCASVGGRVGRSEGLRALALAFDHGITAFDTARSYGYGESERILGEFLKGRREQVFVSTKCGIGSLRPSPLVRAGKNLARAVFGVVPALRAAARAQLGKQHRPGLFTQEEIRRSVEDSLRELGTDRIDVLFLHDVTMDVTGDPSAVAVLEALRAEGKILRYGASGPPAILATIEPCGIGAEAQQYPVGIAARRNYPPDFPPPPSRARLRLGNQPFSGGAALQAIGARLQTALGDGHGPAELAEVLLRAPLEAGVCDAVVTSMFSPEHIRANAESVLRPRIDTDRMRAALSVLQATGEPDE